MTIFNSIILGIVEGITEFLPISSTAHLDITREILGIVSSDFLKTFEIGIQSGAILAVLLLYGKKLFTSKKYFLNTALAFIPTGIIGFFLYKIVKSLFLGNIYLATSMLFVGGIVIIVFEKISERKISERKNLENHREVEDLTKKELIILGISQAIAVIPGVSRSGAVIVAGRILKIPKTTITEFSFVLAVPTILAATIYDLYKNNFSLSNNEWLLFGVGFLTAFIVAFIVIRWLLTYIRSHSFAIFGWYRIIFSIIILFWLIL